MMPRSVLINCEQKNVFYDIYGNGLKNNKFFLLYNINKDARIAIKNKGGVTDIISICDTIMQVSGTAGQFINSTPRHGR